MALKFTSSLLKFPLSLPSITPPAPSPSRLFEHPCLINHKFYHVSYYLLHSIGAGPRCRTRGCWGAQGTWEGNFDLPVLEPSIQQSRYLPFFFLSSLITTTIFLSLGGGGGGGGGGGEKGCGGGMKSGNDNWEMEMEKKSRARRGQGGSKESEKRREIGGSSHHICILSTLGSPDNQPLAEHKKMQITKLKKKN